MKQRLVEVLVCPVSGGQLSLEVTYSRGYEIILGVLTSALGQSCPIAAGVPRMLAADQTTDGERETANASSKNGVPSLIMGTIMQAVNITLIGTLSATYLVPLQNFGNLLGENIAF